MINKEFWKDGYKRRAAIYIACGTAGLVYEFIFHQPVRTIVALLWAGVVGIGILVWTTFKDRRSED